MVCLSVFAALVCFKPLSLFSFLFLEVLAYTGIMYMLLVVLLHLRLFNIRCSWFHGLDLKQ